MLEFFKNYKIPIIVAVLQFILSFSLKVDRYFFDYSQIIYQNMYIAKGLYLLFLIALWCFGTFVYRKIKERDPLFKRGFNIFLIYFSIMLILIFLTWPGLWSWDDVFVFPYIVIYQYAAWQHILSNIEYSLSLQLLPFLAGIIIIRNFIISILVSSIIVKLETTYNLHLKNKIFDYFLKMLPFLLLPILRYQLSGYRMGLHVYLELFLVVIIICAIKNKEKFTSLQIILFSFLSVVVCCLRSESIVFLPFLFFFIIFGKCISPCKLRFVVLVLILFSILGINKLQKFCLWGKTDYQVVSTVRQCTQLIRAEKQKGDFELLEPIGKVFNLNVIYDNPDKNGLELYWEGNLVKENYIEEEYKNYLKSFCKLVCKFPKLFWKERKELLFDSMGLNGNKNNLAQAFIMTIFSNDESKNLASPIIVLMGERNQLNKPISEKIRTTFVKIICPEHNKIAFNLFLTLTLPLTLFFIFGIVFLIKKHQVESFIFAAFLLKFIVIFLTAPDSLLMYYLSYYLIGYLVLFYFLIKLISLKENKI